MATADEQNKNSDKPAAPSPAVIPPFTLKLKRYFTQQQTSHVRSSHIQDLVICSLRQCKHKAPQDTVPWIRPPDWIEMHKRRRPSTVVFLVLSGMTTEIFEAKTRSVPEFGKALQRFGWRNSVDVGATDAEDSVVDGSPLPFRCSSTTYKVNWETDRFLRKTKSEKEQKKRDSQKRLIHQQQTNSVTKSQLIMALESMPGHNVPTDGLSDAQKTRLRLVGGYGRPSPTLAPSSATPSQKKKRKKHHHNTEDSKDGKDAADTKADPTEDLETLREIGRINSLPVFAIDCEMCRTDVGLELTRISVVDETEKTVYDTYVKPDSPIKDYLTQFSGITPQHMENCTTRLEDVQHWFGEHLSPNNTILVGHGVSNDLVAMKMSNYPFLMDTSQLYGADVDGYAVKPKLRNLARSHLNMEIQQGHGQSTGDGAGHDSVEDAVASLRLVKLKMKNGLDFGRLGGASESVVNLLDGLGVSSTLFDRGHLLAKHSSTSADLHACESDESVGRRLVNNLEAKARREKDALAKDQDGQQQADKCHHEDEQEDEEIEPDYHENQAWQGAGGNKKKKYINRFPPTFIYARFSDLHMGFDGQEWDPETRSTADIDRKFEQIASVLDRVRVSLPEKTLVVITTAPGVFRCISQAHQAINQGPTVDRAGRQAHCAELVQKLRQGYAIVRYFP
eukprot:Clim_evm45s242 gene=Clim_evmTU45s242